MDLGHCVSGTFLMSWSGDELLSPSLETHRDVRWFMGFCMEYVLTGSLFIYLFIRLKQSHAGWEEMAHIIEYNSFARHLQPVHGQQWREAERKADPTGPPGAGTWGRAAGQAGVPPHLALLHRPTREAFLAWKGYLFAQARQQQANR